MRMRKSISRKVIGTFGIGLKDALATFERHQIEIMIESQYGLFTIGKSKSKTLKRWKRCTFSHTNG